MKRIPALVLGATALVYVLEARSFDAGFIADPIGPRAFPYVIGLLALLTSAVLLVTAEPPRETLPDAAFGLRASILVAGLGGYAWLVDDLGFVLTTTLLMTLLVAIFRGRLLPGIVGAVVVSVSVYVLFVYALSVPLPFGRVFGGV